MRLGNPKNDDSKANTRTERFNSGLMAERHGAVSSFHEIQSVVRMPILSRIMSLPS